jgi:type VI secretion system protein ImpB
MSSTSSHDDLSLVRKPRVHITYEVYKGDAREVVELPFVVGVLGDFSGKPTKRLDPLAKRKFITIDRDNFNAVMERMAPGLEYKVKNTLKGDGSEFNVRLKFKAIEEFEPAKVVEQVEPLKKLLEARNKLRDLASKADRSEELQNLLEKILEQGKGGEKLQALSKELGAAAPKGEA